MANTQTGSVKWFNDIKGFWFITGDNGEDVFVHHTGINAEGHRTLVQDERVSFETEQGQKGIQACNVTKL